MDLCRFIAILSTICARWLLIFSGGSLLSALHHQGNRKISVCLSLMGILPQRTLNA